MRHVLSGSVRRDGAAVQVNAQFVSSDNGAVLWSERFDYPDVAVGAWQRDIVSGIARVLDVRMTTAVDGPAGSRNGKRLGAIEATLQGRYLLRHVVTLTDLRRARAHFDAALAIEPDSVAALTGLAESLLTEVEIGQRLIWSPDRQGLVALAEQAITRALVIDAHDLHARFLGGHVLRQQRDLDGALRAYQQVLASNPSHAWAHARAGAVKLLLGRPEEVAVHADAALRLSPYEAALVHYAQLFAGIAEFYLGRDDAAYERMRQAAAAGPPSQFAAWLWMASIDALHGRDKRAAEHLAQVTRIDPAYTMSQWRSITMLLHPRLVAGRERFAEGLRKAGLPE